MGGVHDGDDVRVPDARRQLRFADEAFREGRVVEREGGVEDFDGDFDLEGLVGGEVDGAHAAAAEFADGPATSDDVAGLNFSDEWRHEHGFS